MSILTIEVNTTSLENLPRVENIAYILTLQSYYEKLNTALMKKNIEKYSVINKIKNV